MGNTTSDVNDSLKAQADSENGPELYKLVNVNGGGELARLMKHAIRSRNYEKVDAFIKTEVVKYLYNDGEGANVPIEEVVTRRSGDKVSKQMASSNMLNRSSTKKPVTKELCFRIDKAGAVGESLLHLCMLNGTPLFHSLAKRLIKHFPKMINDIYLSEDYFGETALHMAIVSEDPSMTRFLLMHGADVHQRCCGKFFCPEDQKNNQIHLAFQESPVFSVNTNYMGYAYLGEYALSFAAVLNQVECVRLLMAKKADPNKQDFNGNTVLHMLVIYNNLPMFSLMLLEFHASLHIKNRQSLTPLTLAAKLARKEMFDFILDHLKHVWFAYADISFGSYPLATIDTIAEDGTTDTNSAIYLIADGATEEHLDLLEGLVVDLLTKKWHSYIKNKFYLEVVFFIFYFIIAGLVVFLKRMHFDYLITDTNCTDMIAVSSNKSIYALSYDCRCAYLYPDDPNRVVRLLLEIALMIYSVVYLVILLDEVNTQKLRLYVKTLVFNPSKVFSIISLLTLFMILPMRLACCYEGEDYLLVISIIFKSIYILYLGRGFRSVSTFVFVIHKGIKTNFYRFVIIYAVFMMAFSQSFYVIYDFGASSHHHLFASIGESFYDLFLMSLDDVEDAYDDLTRAKYGIVGRVMFVIFIVLVSILLINLLIAMMADTYNETTMLKREWLRQWAKQVLTIEQNVGIKERLKQQKKYANILNNGDKVFIVRWRQTDKEREEFKSSRHNNLIEVF